jgi:hypothetical protein
VIRGWAASDTRYHVDVNYIPFWTCGFFRLADCALGHLNIGRVPVEQDGTFSVDLPDFLRDEVITRFKVADEAGELFFIIRDERTGNTLFDLKPEGKSICLNRLPLRSTYPQEQVFSLEPPR